MGVRNKIERAKGYLRGESRYDPHGAPGVVEQLAKWSIAPSTAAAINLQEPTESPANMDAGVKHPSAPVYPTNTPTVQTKLRGTIKSDEWKDLWLQAYVTSKVQEPELMEDYTRILLHELNTTLGGNNSRNAPISNHTLVQLMRKKLDGFSIPSSRSEDKIEKVVKVLMAAKSFIDFAFQSEPHAAVAWTGVSMFLPLLINPITEKAGCREGLEKIPPLIDRYSLLEISVSDPTSTNENRSSKVKQQLKKTILQLYTKILLYEARVIVQFSGKFVIRHLRDTFKLNDWKNMFNEINKLDLQCEVLIHAIDRDLHRKAIEEQRTLLEKVSNGLNTSQKIEDYQACFQSFRTGNLYELQKNQNPSRIPGTCKWVLEHPTFMDWKQGNGPGVLWISADPGYGKSVLSRALVDENLVATEQTTDVCYFFFKDISKEQRSLTKALAALLHQIFSSQKHLLKYTEPGWAKNNIEIANSVQEMWAIMENIAMDPNARNVICVLDALDECESSERDYFLEQLQKLYKSSVHDRVTRSSSFGLSTESLISNLTADSKTWANHTDLPPLKVKFLITSRPYYEIEEQFKNLTNTFSGIRLAGEDTTAMIKQEINLVIDAEVDKLKLPPKTNTWLRSRLKDTEHRTYLWLYLIMDTIRHSATACSQEKIFRRILDAELPSTIDEAYEAILLKSPDKQEATKLLHIVVGAERPLTLSELNIALNIDKCYDGSQSFENIELEDPGIFASQIRRLRGLFVSISNSRVYLIHQTAKEFLRSKDSSPAPTGWKHSLSRLDSHSILAEICVSYLYLKMFSENNTKHQCFIRSPEGQPHISNEGRFMFLKYASDYWMKHWDISPSDIDMPTIIELCSPSVRRSIWLRACLGGKHPPKHLQDSACTISELMKLDDFDKVNAMSTLMITSCLGLINVSEALLASPLSHSEANELWKRETALSLAIHKKDYKMINFLKSSVANTGSNSSDENVRIALEVALKQENSGHLTVLLNNEAKTHAALIMALEDYILHWSSELFDFILMHNGPLTPCLRVRLLKIAMSNKNVENGIRAVKFVLECPHEQSVEETLQEPLYLALTGHILNVGICSLIINDPAIHDIDNCWELNDRTGSRHSIVHYITSRCYSRRLEFRQYPNEVALLKILGARGASFDRHYNGSTFLYAARYSQVDYFRGFIQGNPKLATFYINGDGLHVTPMEFAASNRNFDMIRCLLEHGANINRSFSFRLPCFEEDYFSAILTAIEHGNVDSMSEIKVKGGLLDTLSIQQVQKLIGHGFDINMKIKGQNLLSYAASCGNVYRVQWLIDHGADVDGRFQNEQSVLSSPLMETIWGCKSATAASLIVKILLNKGANVDGPRCYKVHNGPIVASCSHLAIMRDSVGILQTLLDHNADVNLHGDDHGVLLKTAAVNGQVQIVKLLVSLGADIDIVGIGPPILHEAIVNRQIEVVVALLDLGAYINIVDHIQRTPLQLAKDMHYAEMVSLLLRRGAL
ncbi:uncharacterized protein EAE98_012445 [Botrytis deweyae]|uniref:NWD NACHT-NTPase N-terminal domain-containing protein n=1 Tax=Botrytis deweyae TaxID=2478750 RepID=A0ABQ7I333_9HELO|nr:uncharacterized protein EAE98_012445 [Botrytis deweyae]KAF7908887.1 hypothetical protein EAE98_012445 [Botrytis deweyae]